MYSVGTFYFTKAKSYFNCARNNNNVSWGLLTKEIRRGGDVRLASGRFGVRIPAATDLNC